MAFSELIAKLGFDMTGFRKGLAEANIVADKGAAELRKKFESKLKAGLAFATFGAIYGALRQAVAERELQRLGTTLGVTGAEMDKLRGISNISGKSVEELAGKFAELAKEQGNAADRTATLDKAMRDLGVTLQEMQMSEMFQPSPRTSGAIAAQGQFAGFAGGAAASAGRGLQGFLGGATAVAAGVISRGLGSIVGLVNRGLGDEMKDASDYLIRRFWYGVNTEAEGDPSVAAARRRLAEAEARRGPRVWTGQFSTMEEYERMMAADKARKGIDLSAASQLDRIGLFGQGGASRVQAETGRKLVELNKQIAANTKQLVSNLTLQ